jgi:hypothetical protein
MLGGTEDVSGFFGPRKGFRCLYGLARIRAWTYNQLEKRLKGVHTAAIYGKRKLNVFH